MAGLGLSWRCSLAALDPSAGTLHSHHIPLASLSHRSMVLLHGKFGVQHLRATVRHIRVVDGNLLLCFHCTISTHSSLNFAVGVDVAAGVIVRSDVTRKSALRHRLILRCVSLRLKVNPGGQRQGSKFCLSSEFLHLFRWLVKPSYQICRLNRSAHVHLLVPVWQVISLSCIGAHHWHATISLVRPLTRLSRRRWLA